MKGKNDDEIEPFDGFTSLQQRDIALNKARRKARQFTESKHLKQTRKLIRSAKLESDNVEVLKKTLNDNLEIYKGNLRELRGDVDRIVGILERHSHSCKIPVSLDDLQFIDSLKIKMEELQRVVDKDE